MAALTLLHGLVRLDVPGCPDPLITHALRMAAEEFYARTLIKRVELNPIATMADVAEYTLNVPAGYAVSKALHVWLDGAEITPIGMDDRDGICSTWRDETDEPSYFYLPNTEQIGLFKTPDGNYTVVAEVALQIAHDATDIDDWVYQQYREGIAHGAKARLMEQPGKPWSSKAAVYHNGMFEKAIDKAMDKANRGHARAPRRTRAVFGVR